MQTFQSKNEKIPGTYPRQLIKNARNVDSDHFIESYLKNEHENEVDYNLRLRNPLFVDFRYHPTNKNQNNNYQQDQIIMKQNPNHSQYILPKSSKISSDQIITPKSSSNLSQYQIGRTEFTNFLDILPLPSPQYQPIYENKINKVQSVPILLPASQNFYEPQLDQKIQTLKSSESQSIPKFQDKIASPEIIQQNFNPMNLRVTNRNKNKEKFSVLPMGGQFAEERRSIPYLVDPQVVTSQLNQYQPIEHNQLKNKYIRHDMINHQTLQDYIPRYNVDAGVNKYSRPQFKDFTLNQFSAAQVIKAKNDIHGVVFKNLQTQNKRI